MTWVTREHHKNLREFWFVVIGSMMIISEWRWISERWYILIPVISISAYYIYKKIRKIFGR